LVDGDIILSGGGKVIMSNTVDNAIVAAGTGFDMLTNEETISGAGQIGAPSLGGGPLTLVNAGTINANASAGMTIETLGGLTNTGTIEATNGATLQFLSMGPQSLDAAIINTGGTISANASTLSLNSSTILGGAVTLTGASTLLLNNSAVQGVTLNTSTTGIIEAVNGQNNLIDASTVSFHNTGTLYANGGSLIIEGPGTAYFTNDNQATGTLTGGSYIATGGNIEWNAGANGITTLAASVTENNDYQLFNTNRGTNMLANLTSITAAGALSLGLDAGISDAGAFSNAGSLSLLSGSIFSVGSLTQISGGSLTAGTYVLGTNLNLTGATQTITTNAANLTLAGGTIENANSTNALSGLASNTGSLTIAGSGNSFSTTAGSFSNTGTLIIDSGNSFSASGLTQINGSTLSAGTYVLGGNLNLNTNTAINITTNSANLTLAGGIITDNSPLMPGVVNALAGLASNTDILTIAGTANNVSATGVVLTVEAAGAAKGNGGVVQSPVQIVTAAVGTKTATGGNTLVSGLRRRVTAVTTGIPIFKPVVVAGLGQGSEHPGAVPVRGLELHNLRSWERIPVYENPAQPITVPAMPRPGNDSSMRSARVTSDLQMGEMHPIGVQRPVSGWIGASGNRQAPVQILRPTLPRLAR
jgi:hypothetical protein